MDLAEVLKSIQGEISGIDYNDLTKAEKNILRKCEQALGEIEEENFKKNKKLQRVLRKRGLIK
jgi:hypothetical protein